MEHFQKNYVKTSNEVMVKSSQSRSSRANSGATLVIKTANNALNGDVSKRLIVRLCEEQSDVAIQKYKKFGSGLLRTARNDGRFGVLI